jgi:hypothetical protein
MCPAKRQPRYELVLPLASAHIQQQIAVIMPLIWLLERAWLAPVKRLLDELF